MAVLADPSFAVLHSQYVVYIWSYSAPSLSVNISVLRSSWKLLYSNLDSGESLLRAIFDRTSAALSQIASSVLGLWLHQDLELLPITPLGELSRQWPTFHCSSWLERAAGEQKWRYYYDIQELPQTKGTLTQDKCQHTLIWKWSYLCPAEIAHNEGLWRCRHQTYPCCLLEEQALGRAAGEECVF